MSFYRTYRPQVIEEIDNVAVRAAILRLLGKPKKDLPHAYLFTGPRGGGKTTAARIIAKLFNCLHPSTSSGPCGKCEQCVAIAEGRNLDVLELDAASNRGIDEIRAIRDGINLAPAGAGYKIYIIDEVHMLTTEAFNALLKTLEEPPAHAAFVLATTNPEKVPVTIQSRCVGISFAKATVEELTHALARIVKSEKISIGEESLALIADNVDGSFRDAVKCLEQASFTKGKITPDVIRATLAVSEEKTRSGFLDNVRGKDAKKALHGIGELVREGKDVKMFLTDCLSDLERYLISFVCAGDSGGWSEADLKSAIRTFSQAYTEMKGSAIAQLPLELAVVELCGQQAAKPQAVKSEQPASTPISSDTMLTVEHLVQHWPDVIAELKPYNHSVAGVMRSTRPSRVAGGIVTIEAFYTFHKDKLSETKTKEVIAAVLKKLFGENVKVEIVLGSK